MIDFPTTRPARVALLGVGNDTNGDDGAGVRVVGVLRAMTPQPANVLFIEAGAAPESYTGPLRRFAPDLVIEIDAAILDQEAGSVGWLDWRQADGLSASTHTLPPSVLATFLEAELGCDVCILGIQPERLEPGSGLSPAVAAAVRELAGRIHTWLTTHD